MFIDYFFLQLAKITYSADKRAILDKKNAFYVIFVT